MVLAHPNTVAKTMLHYDNRSRCPLGYKPREHRKIESSFILSCGVHGADSHVDIGYDYQVPYILSYATDGSRFLQIRSAPVCRLLQMLFAYCRQSLIIYTYLYKYIHVYMCAYIYMYDRNLCQDLCFLHWDIKIEKSKILHCKKASSNTDMGLLQCVENKTN